MSDPADQGNEAAELFLEVAKRNHKPAPVQHGVGFCLNCGAEVEGDKRWCSVECRDDHQRATGQR